MWTTHMLGSWNASGQVYMVLYSREASFSHELNCSVSTQLQWVHVVKNQIYSEAAPY